jgi:formylglycine-generating enzyme required for sulfatase activity
VELLSLFEVCGCFIDGFEVVGLIVDVVAWINGRPNRQERRAAARRGEAKPQLDSWNWMVVVLTPILVVLTILVVAKWLGWDRAAEPHVKAAVSANLAQEESNREPGAFAGSNAGDECDVVGIKFCWCPAGRFIMGSPRNEPERRLGEDQVEVTLTKGFWMAKFEATQGQWKRVVGDLPGPLTAELPEGDDFPVGNVNFAEAEAFCQKLTELGRRSGELPNDWEFRLPTEAQWEYSCRAGTTTATSFGDKLSSKQANFKGEPYNGAEPGPSLGRAAQVGGYPANAWGLHDMHGNTFEWCRDWYHRNPPGGTDPDLRDAESTATKSDHGDISRVRRGGCWADMGWPCRSAFRLRFEPHRRYDHIGFRVVAVRATSSGDAP